METAPRDPGVSAHTVALYVFCKSWPSGGGDKRLLQVAILLFVVGILKFIRRPWSLENASIDSVMTSSFVYPERREEGNGLVELCQVLCLPLPTSYNSAPDAAAMKQEEEHDLCLEGYVQRARELVQVTEIVDTEQIWST